MTKFKDIPNTATVLYYSNTEFRNKRGSFGCRMDVDSALNKFIRKYGTRDKDFLYELIPTPLEVTVQDLAYWLVTGHIGIISDSVMNNEDRKDMTQEIIDRLGEKNLQAIADAFNKLVNDNGTITVGPAEEPIDMSEVEEAQEKKLLAKKNINELWDLCRDKLSALYDKGDVESMQKFVSIGD